MRFQNPQFDDLYLNQKHITSMISYNRDFLLSDGELLKGNTLVVFLKNHQKFYKLELATKYGKNGYMIAHKVDSSTIGADIKRSEFNQILTWVEDYLQISINEVTLGGLTYLDDAEEPEQEKDGIERLAQIEKALGI